jgi:Tol biopolymer transport system component
VTHLPPFLALAVLAPAGAAATPAPELVFQRTCGTACADLYGVRADGTGLRRLTRDSRSFDPAWSPDASHIVFVRIRRGIGELWTMKADGTGIRLVVAARASASLSAPDWLNRRDLVWLRTRRSDGRTDLIVDGRVVAVGVSPSAAPAASPDGTRVAYEDSAGRIVVLGLAGGRRVLARRATSPAWSRDAGRIAYTSRNGIVVAAADGADARRITTRGASPTFSPEGSRVAFSAPYEHGGSGIWVTQEAGGIPRRLTASGRLQSDGLPDWR